MITLNGMKETKVTTELKAETSEMDRSTSSLAEEISSNSFTYNIKGINIKY
jgi:hypothetical protein